MIHLSSDLLNSPEKILEELNETKKKIVYYQTVECTLKDELEQHLREGRIRGIFKWKGITANRLSKPQKYIFSEELRNREERYKAEIAKDKELEIKDNKTIQKLEPTPYWRITVDK